ATVSCPACYTDVLAVGATDGNDQRAYFSNYGPGVNIAAPGVGILSTYPTAFGSYNTLSGTSMATPFVSGAASLVLAVHPTWSYPQVRAKLISTGHPVAFPGSTLPRLNAATALSAAPAPTASPTSSPTPTATPAPTSTPKPSATPTPAPTAVPTPTP